MAAYYYISITRWQHQFIRHSPDGSTILYFNYQMAALFNISFNRIWQHNIIFQSPNGSTILCVNPQMAAHFISYSPDGSIKFYFNYQMVAPYYISFTRWQHNLMGPIPRWQHHIIFQSPDGSTILYFNHQMTAPFYISFTRWQYNIIFQSTDGNTIL